MKKKFLYLISTLIISNNIVFNFSLAGPKLSPQQQHEYEEELHAEALAECEAAITGAPLPLKGASIVKVEHSLEKIIDDANSAPQQNSRTLPFPETNHFRLRVAVAEYLHEKGDLIGDRRVYKVLQKIATNEIKDPLRDPEALEYSNILVEIEHNSKAIQRLESEAVYYGEILGKDILSLRDIEKKEGFRFFSLKSWFRLILSLLHSKPEIQYSFANRFTHELKTLQPKTRLKTLKRMVRKKHLPGISHLEAFTILSAFDGTSQLAAYQILKKSIFTSLELFSADQIMYSISKLDPPTITKVIREGKLRITLDGILRLAQDRPELFHSITDNASLWGLHDLSIESVSEITNLIRSDKKLDSKIIKKLTEFMPASQEIGFIFKLLDSDMVIDRDATMSLLEETITDSAHDGSPGFSKRAFIKLLSINPEVMTQMLNHREKWKIDFTLGEEDIQTILSQESEIDFSDLQLIMNALMPDPTARKHLIHQLIEKNLITEKVQARLELATLAFAGNDQATMNQISILLDAKSEEQRITAFLALLSISPHNAIEIARHPRVWEINISFASIDPALIRVLHFENQSLEQIEFIASLFPRTVERNQFLAQLTEALQLVYSAEQRSDLVSKIERLQEMVSKFAKQQNLHAEKISVDDAIALADATSTYAAADGVLNKFFDKNKEDLTIEQAIEIAQRISSSSGKDRIILQYVHCKIDILTPEDLTELSSEASTYEGQNKAIRDYALKRVDDLTVSQILDLGKNTNSSNLKNELLEKFAERHRANLDADDIQTLASEASTYASTDRIIEEYVKVRAGDLEVHEAIELSEAATGTTPTNKVLKLYASHHINLLSVADVILLSEATKSYDSQDSILREYLSRHRGKLSVNDLEDLANAASSTTLRNEILSSAIE